MYNEALKTDFIRQYTTNISTADISVRVFNAIEIFEEKYGCDFYQMSTDHAAEAINSVQGLRSATAEVRLAVLRAYVNYCIGKGLDANMDIVNIEPSSVSHIRNLMVKDPIHLSACLNSIFKPTNEETVENISRLFVWFWYSGMTREQCLTVTSDDIDYKYMEIHCGNRKFPIYRESLDALISCVDSTEFADMRKYSGDIRYRKRASGNEVLRGFNGVSLNTLSVQTLTKCRKAVSEGATDVKINWYNVRLSGIFYRMYQKETLGFPVDFSEDAAIEMEGKDYKTNKKFTLGVKKVRIIRDFEEDYAKWKLAYNL